MTSTSTPTERISREIIHADAAAFEAAFNSTAFAFRHELANSPLFEIGRLAEVAERVLERGDTSRFVVFDAASASSDTKFSRMPPKQRLADTIRRIGEAGSWLKLSSAQEIDPEYAELMASILREVERLTGLALRDTITWSGLTVFVASPQIVTPYHIDHESNFLFQISGSKDVWLYDPTDREILSNEEIEKFYLGNVEAATYHSGIDDKGTVFHLSPGDVVHHPPLAPHWVQNGNDVSVSVGIAFSLPSLEARARVYQANYCLRRIGLHPGEPGRSRVVDGVKSAAIGLMSNPHPKTREQRLFSGMERALLPVRIGHRIRRQLHG